MPLVVDAKMDGFIKALQDTVKSINKLSTDVVSNEKKFKSHKKVVQESHSNLKKYSKEVGMTDKQMKDLSKTLGTVYMNNFKTSKSIVKLTKDLDKANKEIASLKKNLDASTSSMKALSAQVDKLSSKTNEGTKGNKVFSLSMQDIIRHAQRLIRYYVLLQTAMAAYHQGLKVFSEGSEYEKSIKTLQGVTRSSAKEISKVEKEIRRLGATTEWTANEVAKAAKFLGMAGFNLLKIEKSLAGTLEIATAGQIGLAEAADITTNILTAFGMEADQLSRVNDVLIGTITRTNSTIIELAEAMKYAAPIATSLGYSIEQVSAFLGILHNAGIKGSMAGTNLARAMFVTEKAFSRFESLRVYDVLERTEKGTNKLTDAIAMMRKEGWSTTKIMKIFGDRGAKAALIFMNLDAQLAGLTKRLENVKGESKSLADIMRSSLVVQWQLLGSAISDIRIDIFTKYAPAVNELLETMTKVITNNKDAILGFIDVLVWAGKVLVKFASYFALFALPGTVVAFSMAIGKAGGAVIFFSKALVALKLVMNSHPILFFMTVGAAAIALFTSHLGEATDSQNKFIESTEKLTDAEMKKNKQDQVFLEFQKRELETQKAINKAKREGATGYRSQLVEGGMPKDEAYVAYLKKLIEENVSSSDERDAYSSIIKARDDMYKYLSKTSERYYEIEKKKIQDQADIEFFTLTGNMSKKKKLLAENALDMKYYGELASKYSKLFNIGGSPSHRKQAILSFRKHIQAQKFLEGTSYIERKALWKDFIDSLDSSKNSAREKELSDLEKYLQDQYNLEKKYTDRRFKETMEHEKVLLGISQSLESEKTHGISDLDRIYKEQSDVITEAMNRAVKDYEKGIDGYTKYISRMKKLTQMENDLLISYNKKFSVMTKSNEKKTTDSHELSGLDRLREIEEDRTRNARDLNKTYQETLAVSIVLLAKGKELTESLGSIGEMYGSLAGGQLGKELGVMGGGVFGGAIGAVIGQTVGEHITNSIGGGRSIFDDLEDQSNTLANEFNTLQQSMKDFDEQLRFSGLSTSQKLTELGDIVDNVNDLEKKKAGLLGDQEAAKVKWSSGGYGTDYGGASQFTDELKKLKEETNATQAEINEATANLEKYRESILQVGEAAKDSIDDINKSRDDYYISKRKETQSLTAFKADSDREAKEELRLLTKLRTEESKLSSMDLVNTDTTSPEYLLQQVRIAAATEDLAEQMQISWDTEQEYLSKLEELIDSQQGLINSLDETRQSLIDSDLNPDQSFAAAETRYNQLKAAAMTTGASQQDIEDYQNYINTYLEKARRQYASSDDYQRIFDQVTGESGDIYDVQEALRQAIIENTNATNQNSESLGWDPKSSIGAGGGQDPFTMPVGYVPANGGPDPVTEPMPTVGTTPPPVVAPVVAPVVDPAIEAARIAAEALTMKEYWDAVAAADKAAADKAAAEKKAREDAAAALSLQEYWKTVDMNFGSYADGGISTGPDSGHMELLHGTEAVIPLQNGSVPVQMSGTDMNNSQIIALLEELIYVSSGNRVIIDGDKFEGVIRNVSDENRVDADNNGMFGRRQEY